MVWADNGRARGLPADSALTWALESEIVGEPGRVLMGRAVAGWVRRS